MIKTGIFGGSFNPIHKGHTALAQQIIAQNLVDELWFIVSPQNPLKTDSSLMDDDLRLEMVKTATEGMNQVSASDFEFHLPRPSFMYQTLCELEKSYPDRSFVLIIGADNWALFDKWFRYKDILAQWPIIIYPRESYPIDETSLPGNVTFIDCPLYPISSTEIRQHLANGKSVSKWLDEKVDKIMKQHYKTV